MNFTKLFNQISKSDASIAGGKGASLGEMTQAGLLVPPGFVVLACAFEKFLEETDLNVEIDAILHSVNIKEMHTIENASEKIKDLILKAKMPKDISEEVKKEFKNLNAEFVAVRSSATAEDSSSAAWAGQLDTFLNTTEKTLLANVQKCWASLFTPRAIFYRFEKGLHNSKISVAVVVQKMVESEVSGIAFSVHPVTQDHNQLIIEAGYGLGEAIVSGQITPDSYVVEKEPRRIIDKNVSVQERGIYRKSKDGENEWQNIPQEKGQQQKLTDEQILELSELIIKIENHYCFPVDIEWAYEKNKFYIVQSRPITTLEKNNITEKMEKFKKKAESQERVFVKTITRELTLFTFEIWHRAQQYSFSTVLLEPNIAEDIGRCDIFAGSNGVLSSYVDKYLFLTANKLIKKRISEDKNFFPKIFRECDKNLKIIKKIWKNDILENRNELLSFYHLNYAIWPAMTYALYLPSLVFVPESIKKLAWEYRILGDTLADASDRVIRNTLLKLYPYLGKLSFFLTISEIQKNQVPNIKELRKREKWLFLYNGDIHTGNLQKFAKKNNIILPVNIINSGIKEFCGAIAFRGLVKGYAKIITKREMIPFLKNNEILVAIMTTPDYIPAMKKASAFITDEGGITCHAAIIAREMKKPCIIGTKIATKVLHDGDLVEVDADKGVVRILEKAK